MANTYYNFLAVVGPELELRRLKRELAHAGDVDPLQVHVPLPADASMEDCRQAWGTRGTTWAGEPRIVDGQLEWSFDTANAPAWLWVQRLGEQRPELTLKLFLGCMLEGVGGLITVERGDMTHNELIGERFGPFFAKHGRPGFFIPYWEDEDGRELTEAEMAGDEPSLQEFGALHDAEHGVADAELSLALLFEGTEEEASRHFYPAGEHAGPTLAEAGEYRSAFHHRRREAELREESGYDSLGEVLAAMQAAAAGDLSPADRLLAAHYSDPDMLTTGDGFRLGSLSPLAHALDNVSAYAHARELLDAAEPALCRRLASAGLGSSACRRPAREEERCLHPLVREAAATSLYYELYSWAFRDSHLPGRHGRVDRLQADDLAARLHRSVAEALAATTADSGAAALHLRRWLGDTGFDALQQAYTRATGQPLREGDLRTRMPLSVDFVTDIYEEVLNATVDGRSPAEAVCDRFERAFKMSV